MLSVLAVIGKIIGFTLLGILGLLILILLIALFVPLRYKIDANGGKFEEGVKVDAKGAASYLLHIISVKGGFLKNPKGEEDAGVRSGSEADDGHKGPEAEGVSVCARLFGIKVFPKKEKEPKEKKSKKGKKDAGEDFEEAEVLEVITAEGPKEDAKPEAEGEKEPEGGQPEGTGTAADSTGTGPAEKAEAPQPAEQAESAKPAASDKDEDFDEDFFFQDVSDYKEEPEETEEPEKEKKTLSEKIEGIRQKGEDLADKLEDVKAKIDKVLDFVQDNTTQEEFSLILKRLGKALKHYIPKKFEGYARVGLSDPATTGKILMYWYSLIYPRVSDTFRLMGDFDEEVIEGDVHVKGRLRLNHIVWFGIKMLLDKRFRKLLKRGKKLAKELKGSAIEDDEDDDDKDDKKHKDDKDGTIKEEE